MRIPAPAAGDATARQACIVAVAAATTAAAAGLCCPAVVAADRRALTAVPIMLACTVQAGALTCGCAQQHRLAARHSRQL